MKRILIGGCGGSASVGFTRSIKKSNDSIYTVGTDANIFSLPFGETDAKYLVPRADNPGYIENLNEIIDNEKIEFLHTQPDPEVLAVSKNRHKIRAKTFLPEHKTIEICQDKYMSYSHWLKHGLEMPKTILITDEGALEKAFQEIKTPFWLRATSGAGGKGSIIVKDIRQAKVWIDYWNGWGTFIASELLPERLLTWQSIWYNGELVCAQTRERLSWALAHSTISGVSGMTGVGRTMKRADIDKIAQDAIFAIDKKPHGIFGVDMKENKNGIPCPTEINIGRFFTTIQFFAELGLNMPEIYLKIAYEDRMPKIENRINPLPDDYFWLRTADSKPILMSKNDLKKVCKNTVDIQALIKPDKTVKYDVRQ